MTNFFSFEINCVTQLRCPRGGTRRFAPLMGHSVTVWHKWQEALLTGRCGIHVMPSIKINKKCHLTMRFLMII